MLSSQLTAKFSIFAQNLPNIVIIFVASFISTEPFVASFDNRDFQKFEVISANYPVKKCKILNTPKVFTLDEFYFRC